MNDFKECINTANYIVSKITEKTGYKVNLNKIKESTDEDDFYILYRMTINGKNYKLYAGDEDFTIAGEDNEIYIESDGLNTNRNIEFFCKRIDEVNESMDLHEAKEFLNSKGFILESRDRLTTDDILQGLEDLGIEVEDREWGEYKKPIITIHLGDGKYGRALVRGWGNIMKMGGYWSLTLAARTNFVPPADVDIEPVVRARIYSIEEMKRLITEFAETMSNKGVKPKPGAAWGALV